MKKLKKLLCVLLSAAMLLCCSVAASAAEPRVTAVGQLTIFSYKGNDEDGSSGGSGGWGYVRSGHAFLSFKNTSSQAIKIGGLNVGPGHEITFGTWGSKPAGYTTDPDNGWHKGIWYNLESYLINNYNDMRGRVSLTMYLTMDNVNTINDFIKSCDTWDAESNCSTFAMVVWNSVAPAGWIVSAGLPNLHVYSPVYLCVSIQSKDGWQLNRAVANIAPIGYLDGDKFVSVKFSPSSNKTLNYSTRINDYIPNTMEAA